MQICSNCGSPLTNPTGYCEACGIKNTEISDEINKPEDNTPVEQLHTETSLENVAFETQDSENSVCCVTQSYYQPTLEAKSPTPMKVWAIIVLIIASIQTISYLIFPLPAIAVVTSIISLVAIGDSKVAVNKQIFNHKLSTAKVLNIVSTIIIVVSALLVMAFMALVNNLGSLIQNSNSNDFPSYFENYNQDDFLEQNPYNNDYNNFEDFFGQFTK